jgi:UDP-2-acetamido-2-deoxy-ribo-hexuluronate aminotransferase
MKINLIDVGRQYQKLKTDIDTHIQAVIDSGAFIMGEQIPLLEKQLAQYVGVKYAVGCASGTDALLLALMAYDIQPGDEIITTPFTFIATCEVVALLKAKPVFVDIDPVTYNIDPRQIPQAITKKTRGIIPVDLYGQCADYDEINAVAKDHKLFVIEDAAQSFGAEYKGRKACSLADVGCTSFFPAKPLGCYGDGGMVFTNDEKLGKLMESLRIHGKGNDKYDNVRVGLNARLDTLQAGILLAKFKHYPAEIIMRDKVADYYTQGLHALVTTPTILPHNHSVFAQYSIQTPKRNDLMNFLKAAGIPTAIHYPKPLHLQTVFAHLQYRQGDFPITEQIAEQIMSLPMHPYLTKEEQDFIIDQIRTFIHQKSR